MGRHRKIGVIEWKLKHLAEVEFGVVTQSGAGVGGRMFALGDPEFTAVEPICLLAGPIRHANKEMAFVVLMG
jgi:hypothetical protein